MLVSQLGSSRAETAAGSSFRHNNSLSGAADTGDTVDTVDTGQSHSGMSSGAGDSEGEHSSEVRCGHGVNIPQ